MAELLKDKYHLDFFHSFISIIKNKYPTFDEQRFLRKIFDEEWENKELKQRIRHITLSLREGLPDSYSQSLSILKEIASECRGIEYLFFPDFVEAYGLDHWEESILALERFTPSSSSEFAVRAFILKDQERMVRQMEQWANHHDHHVRRLSSEGCRPRLPWSMKLGSLVADPSPILPILEKLREDSSLYVRKSVANNLNDISKDHPHILKSIATSWLGHHSHTDWIVKHASRSLLKQGDPDLLQLFGYIASDEVKVRNLNISSPVITLGETLTFSFELLNQSKQAKMLRIEYFIDYVKANGNHSPKVFQLTQREFPSGSTHLRKKHAFKDLTTRKHYEGRHRLRIRINGEEKSQIEFDLLIPHRKEA
ncbi:hypothetical protein [Caldalkalibacillus mannanilyticus]|uniref:hypothetical protein n=1 Tax=Caldalkalibacillus mannanilyticus TaxID=1418 RepID=UPI00046A479D|nr:hypothetical protein [Caldalkalibacillus mannanilyticus]